MASVNLQVGASADDALQSYDNSMDLTGSTIGLISLSRWGGIRFQNVSIPRGAVIVSAELQVYVHSTTYDDPDVDIYVDDTDNASAFTTDDNDISDRTRTTAVVTWSDTGLGTGWVTSPDIASVIQEIVDRSGWSSGNDLVVIFDALSNVALRFRTYDYSGNAYGAKLSVTYSLAARRRRQENY